MHWGRADLGVYKNGKPGLYIEVGTTSFDDKLIEFRRSDQR